MPFKNQEHWLSCVKSIFHHEIVLSTKQSRLHEKITKKANMTNAKYQSPGSNIAG
jgi:hypothetical protein